MEKGKEEGKGKEKKNEEGKRGRKTGKGKGKWKEDSLRNVGRTGARTDTKVILYSVQCYA